ncbi:hypothetical protein ACIPW5_06800 [Streptomyces sp. NPDC090077]|uniref:hypothetical protein n=1 Tax=Streptomyces sp. NPDC090077 TaxID=3365938 RepID=UPI0038090E75
MRIRNWRRHVVSILVWWALITLVLALAGVAGGQPVTLPGCAAAAAFLLALGEAGHWLRQRLRIRRAR